MITSEVLQHSETTALSAAVVNRFFCGGCGAQIGHTSERMGGITSVGLVFDDVPTPPGRSSQWSSRQVCLKALKRSRSRLSCLSATAGTLRHIHSGQGLKALLPLRRSFFKAIDRASQHETMYFSAINQRRSKTLARCVKTTYPA